MPPEPTRPDGMLYRALVVALFAALAFATLFRGWDGPGWPSSHEGYWFAQRIHVYARHYAVGDLIPLWTSIDASGFGSPMPVAYHKLFYMLAGGLALATGSIKTAIVYTLGILLTLGALGLHQTMRAIGSSRLAAVVGGCCLVVANYTVTNWLVRGAMAETAGAMLTPWLLLYFIKSIDAGRLHAGLGVTLGLVWLGHSVLAFYAVLTLGIVYLLLAAMRLAPWSILDPRSAWPAVALFVCILLPFVVPMVVLGRGYDFARIITAPWRPEYQRRPLLSYVWDRDWSAAGQKPFGLTVELDTAMLLLLAVAICAMGIAALRRHQEGHGGAHPLRRAAPFLLLASLGFFLQTSIAQPFYLWVPGAAFIQFPWRLLALMTPSLIVAAVYLADNVLTGNARAFSLGAAVAWMLVSSIAFRLQEESRLALEPVPVLDVRFSFETLREYEPRDAAPVNKLQSMIAKRWGEAGCSYVVQSSAKEVVAVRLLTTCERETALPLPLFASPLHRVGVSGASVSQPCAPVDGFSSVCGAVIPPGTNTVSVKMPTEISLLAWGWERVTARLGETTHAGWRALQDSNLRPPGS